MSVISWSPARWRCCAQTRVSTGKLFPWCFQSQSRVGCQSLPLCIGEGDWAAMLGVLCILLCLFQLVLCHRPQCHNNHTGQPCAENDTLATFLETFSSKYPAPGSPVEERYGVFLVCLVLSGGYYYYRGGVRNFIGVNVSSSIMYRGGVSSRGQQSVSWRGREDNYIVCLTTSLPDCHFHYSYIMQHCTQIKIIYDYNYFYFFNYIKKNYF